jgi:hypothetical protein
VRDDGGFGDGVSLVGCVDDEVDAFSRTCNYVAIQKACRHSLFDQALTAGTQHRYIGSSGQQMMISVIPSKRTQR